MATTRVSTKGQVVIPREVRARHGWEAGTELTIEDHSDGLVLRAVKPFAPSRIEDTIGCTEYNGPAKSLEEMDAGIDSDLKKQWSQDEGT
jgi:AbrB family looped-hinge helix DNA binding protein